MEYSVSTEFGTSKDFCGGRRSRLVVTGQGNVVSVNMCRDSSCIALKDIEKENLGFLIRLRLTTEVVHQLAIAFVGDNDFSSEEKKTVEK